MSAVLDASALISFLRDEPGAEAVQNLLSLAQTCYVYALNLCEVYYDLEGLESRSGRIGHHRLDRPWSRGAK